MEKIKNIEFLRIIGCISIVLIHFFNKNHINTDFFTIPLFSKLNIMTSNGDKAVDLFFILSGLFFAYKLNLNQSVLEFLKKKIVRFYPVLIFLILVSFIISLFGFVKFNFYANIILLLGLNGTSLSNSVGLNTGLSQFWYISALLWILALYFYLLKNYTKKSVDMIIALITFFAYSYLIHAKGGKISGTDQTFCYIFNVGMLRAFGGIGVGYFIAQFWREYSETIKQISLNTFQTTVITGLEFICVYFIIKNLMLHKLQFNNHIIFIIVFALTVILFLARKGIISKLLDNNICVILAKYSYSIFMIHNLVYHTLRGSIWKYHPELVFQHPILNIIFTILAILILGIILHYLVEVPCANYLQRQNNCKTSYIGQKQ